MLPALRQSKKFVPSEEVGKSPKQLEEVEKSSKQSEDLALFSCLLCADSIHHLVRHLQRRLGRRLRWSLPCHQHHQAAVLSCAS